MRGDLGLCRQIEQNNLVRGAVEGGEAIRQALLQPVEYREDGESTRVKESSAREALAPLIGGEREVETPSGFVDMHSDAMIEMKYHNRWKHGLGQVLAYQSHYPRLARRLHLFAHIGDKDTDKYFEMAKSVCYAHAVKVTFEEVGVEEPALDLDDMMPAPLLVITGLVLKTSGLYASALPRKRRKVVYQSKQHDEPLWFEHASVEEKRAYASMKVRTSIALGEIDILKYYKEQLASVGRFNELDKDEFAERISGVQWRFTTAVGG
ncbi:unnamed protein product, partial [Pylaiella littoralis]